MVERSRIANPIYFFAGPNEASITHKRYGMIINHSGHLCTRLMNLHRFQEQGNVNGSARKNSSSCDSHSSSLTRRLGEKVKREERALLCSRQTLRNSEAAPTQPQKRMEKTTHWQYVHIRSLIEKNPVHDQRRCSGENIHYTDWNDTTSQNDRPLLLGEVKRQSQRLNDDNVNTNH